eukprot:748727-Hanusia_phi.AAC.2
MPTSGREAHGHRDAWDAGRRLSEADGALRLKQGRPQCEARDEMRGAEIRGEERGEGGEKGGEGSRGKV